MKLRINLVAIATFMTLNVYGQNEWTDVTSTYIQDPDFEKCTASNSDVSTGANTQGTSYSDQGWTCMTSSHNNGQTWSNSAVFGYGSGKKLNNNVFPALEKRKDATEGNSNALGITIGRKTELIYKTDEITLPAGHYVLSVWGLNFNSNDRTYFPSQLGFVTANNVGFKSNKTAFTKNVWEEDKVEFSLSEDTKGCIQLGVIEGEGRGSTDCAIMAFDHVKLEYCSITQQEKMLNLLEQAQTLTVPTDNIGDGPFQYSSTPINAFSQAVANAQAKYEAATITADDITALAEAIDTYRSVKDLLNPPATGATFKFQLAYNWPSENKNSYLNSGYCTLCNTRSDQGFYNLSIGTTESAFTDEEYLAQQFTLTPVEGIQNGYIISLVDKEGNKRFICTGSKVGGNDLQIRTTTESSDALAVLVQYAGMNEGRATYHLVSTAAASGTYISFNDRNSYCWDSNYPANVFYIHQKTAEDLPSIVLNMSAGRYATCILPFVRTTDGEAVSNLFNGKINVYTCSDLNNTQLNLQSLEGELQAHVPYILEAVDDVDFQLKGYGTAYATDTEYASGLLVGTYAATGDVPVDCYVLQIQNEHQAFYRVDESYPINKSPYHAYLSIASVPASVKSLDLMTNNQESTGLEHIYHSESHDTQFFSIDGRMLPQPQKGLNIIRTSNGNVYKMFK